MLQPRLQAPRPTLETIAHSLRSLTLIQARHASHAAQGRANGPTDSAGRRLGLKRNNTEHVVPGNIIFKQRGSKWHPGENVGMGRDHTIYALAEGYVRYYRDPLRHPKRKYIGVALAKEGKESVLPTPRNAPTPRRVGMVAVPIKAPVATQAAATAFLEAHLSSTNKAKDAWKKGSGRAGVTAVTDPPIMRANGSRIANVQLVREAAANAVKVRPYVRKDRWFAWRQRTKKFRAKRVQRAAAGKAKKRVAQKGKKAKK
jgi:large subunit ribosomal protein L27